MYREIKESDVLYLEDMKEYVVVDILEYNSKKYCYLAEIKNVSNYIIGELNGNNIDEIGEGEEELLKELVLQFVEHLKKKDS